MSDHEFEDLTTTIVAPSAPVGTAPVADGRAACFIVIAGSEAGKMYKLEGNDMTLGRSPTATIFIDDEGVSRNHARIRISDDGEVTIIDLGSTNGTFCNGDRVRERQLSDGDKILIGTTTILKFSYQDSIEEDFQRRQYESATRDALTGCFNKKYLSERLPAEVAFAVRHDKILSVAMFDIDHFKKINDTYGHLAGDQVLREIVDIVQKAIRLDDVLARYGGEEFALLMRETDVAAAVIVAERVRRMVASSKIMFEDQAISATISLGVAFANKKNARSAAQLLAAADTLLYKAKAGGRNRTESESL